MSYHRNTFAFIGNWNKMTPSGCGFGICRYDGKTGDLTPIKSVFPEISVGATCLDSKRHILYCVNEIMTHPGYAAGGGGQVYAFAIDKKTGDLREINHQPSFGTLPTSVAIDATGKYLIVTNHSTHNPITKTVKDKSGTYQINLEYDEPSTVLYSLSSDGSINVPCDIYKHYGNGPLPKQTHPHPHHVVMSPCKTLFAVCDKGSDKIFFFRINRKTEKLEVCGGDGYRSIPGSGPRYGAFHPTLPFFYITNEHKAFISAFRYDEAGNLQPLTAVSSLPEGCEDHLDMKQTDIRINASGTYLYSLIRGIHAASVFEINAKTGELKKIQTVLLDGAYVRGCTISPDGRFLHIAAVDSGSVIVWRIGRDGKISPTGKKISQPSPCNITFYSASG